MTVAAKHFVLTRFNVRFAKSPPPTEAWLTERLSLFDRYTARSLASQTVAPDGWLVFCGPSPGWLLDELTRIGRDVPFLHLIVDDRVFTHAVAANAISTLVEGMDGRIITTRVDNDDAIATDYVEAVRRAAANVTDGFVNFTHGLQLTEGRAYRRSDPSNPFISRVEADVRALQTVFVDQHQLLSGYGRITQVRTEPMWIQVIHGGNIANVVRGIRADPQRVSARFATDMLDLEPIGGRRLRVEQAVTAAAMGLRVVRSPRRLRTLTTVFGGRD